MEELKNIKITVEAYGEKMVLEFPDEVDMEDLIQKFISIASFLTFSADLINEYLLKDEKE